MRPHYDDCSKKLEEGKIELGEIIAFYTANISAVSFDGYDKLKTWEDDFQAIAGYKVVYPYPVNIKLGKKAVHGTMELLTRDGALCVVHLPEVKKTVAVLFENELQLWNPDISLPSPG